MFLNDIYIYNIWNIYFKLEKGGKEEDCVCDLVEFAMTLCQKLQEVNKDAFNTFQLRVGIRYLNSLKQI